MVGIAAVIARLEPKNFGAPWERRYRVARNLRIKAIVLFRLTFQFQQSVHDLRLRKLGIRELIDEIEQGGRDVTVSRFRLSRHLPYLLGERERPVQGVEDSSRTAGESVDQTEVHDASAMPDGDSLAGPGAKAKR